MHGWCAVEKEEEMNRTITAFYEREDQKRRLALQEFRSSQAGIYPIELLPVEL